MARLFFVEIGEPLPLESKARLHRYGEFTKYLAAKGHDVTWWTSGFSHAPKSHILRERRTESVNGVKLEVLPGLGYSRNVSIDRIRHNQDFARQLEIEWLQLGPAEWPDLVVAPIPILEASSFAVRFACERGIPVVTDIRDRWPDEFLHLAPEPVRPLLRATLLRNWFSMATYICQNSNAILAMSPLELDYGLKLAARPATQWDRYFPLGYPEVFEKYNLGKLTDPPPFLAELGVQRAHLTLAFVGTIGRHVDFLSAFQSLRVLKFELPVQLVIAGDGPQRLSWERLANSWEIPVFFPGWLQEGQIAHLLAFADLGFAPYSGSAIMSLPNKIFEYMAASLPVISSIKTTARDLIELHKCGAYFPIDDFAELTHYLRHVFHNQHLIKQMGENARLLFSRQFAQLRIFDEFEKHLTAIIGTQTSLAPEQPRP